LCSALIDAAEAVRLAPGWAKGYLRKGRALYGLKVIALYVYYVH